jgi:hypothetical protein
MLKTKELSDPSDTYQFHKNNINTMTSGFIKDIEIITGKTVQVNIEFFIAQRILIRLNIKNFIKVMMLSYYHKNTYSLLFLDIFIAIIFKIH